MGYPNLSNAATPMAPQAWTGCSQVTIVWLDLVKSACRVVREAREASALPSAVPACSAVEVHLLSVPDAAAAKLVAHVQAFSQVLQCLSLLHDELVE